MEELPNHFDVIVIGTGMPECIVAAAASRIGKTVLHLERNGYYGGDWASFSFDKFLEWIEDTKSSEDAPSSFEASLLNEGERAVSCRLKSNTISNLTVRSYVPETSSPPEATPDPSVPESPAEEDLQQASEVENENVSEPISSQSEWTVSQFIENRRKFNIDLSPKLMFSRGSLVELLISSNIARYAEFQCVNRVLTYIGNHIEQVPCSRADVFSTKNVTVVEKRMLMKFLTFCLKFEEHPEEYKGYEEAPFSQFLQSKKLTPNVEHYILHALAMVDPSSNTLEGLRCTQKFLQSLGRYGKSPFLCTCYGSAELPQCFCRLCAVYGGMYYLKRNVEALVLDDASRCCGIISMGQRINCQWIVAEASYCPTEFLPAPISQRISKAIFITDDSLYRGEKKENVLMRLPPSVTSSPSVVTVLEFSSKTYVCPEDLYLVYMSCVSAGSTAEEDLTPVANLLFQKSSASVPTEEEECKRPSVLWCTFFNQLDTSNVDLNASTPQGVFVLSSPDSALDYEDAVRQAREVFGRMCPGEEFLPRAPDPEDILIESHNGGGGEEGDSKIENDVTQSDSSAESAVQDTNDDV